MKDYQEKDGGKTVSHERTSKTEQREVKDEGSQKSFLKRVYTFQVKKEERMDMTCVVVSVYSHGLFSRREASMRSRTQREARDFVSLGKNEDLFSQKSRGDRSRFTTMSM